MWWRRIFWLVVFFGLTNAVLVVGGNLHDGWAIFCLISLAAWAGIGLADVVLTEREEGRV